MFRHPYVRAALVAVFIALSATVAFSPSDDRGGGSTSTAVTAGTDADPSATTLDDRKEAIKLLRRQ